MLLLLLLPILHVCSEEVIVDTDACLRGAKARHGDNPNDELDSFLACVLARLDAVSFPHAQFGGWIAKWLNQNSRHTKLTPKIAITHFLVRLESI